MCSRGPALWRWTERRLLGLLGLLVIAVAWGGCAVREPEVAPGVRLVDLLAVASQDPRIADSVGVATVESVAQRSLVGRGVAAHAVRVKVPEGAWLDFQFGLARRDWARAITSVEFSVVVEGGQGEVTPLWSSVIRPHLPVGRDWQSRRLSLAAFSGREVTLRLATRVLPDGAPPGAPGSEEVEGFPAWGRPRVVAGHAAAPPERPDVLLVLINNLRPDHTALEDEAHRATTPALAELAQRGTTFTQAYAQSPWTPASAMSLVTSLYPSITGTIRNDWLLPAQVPTVGEVMAQAGYDTFAFLGSPDLSQVTDLLRGFDYQRVENDPVILARSALEALAAPRARPMLMLLQLNPHGFPYPLDPHVSARFGWNDDVPQPDPSPWPAGPPSKEAVEYSRQGYVTQMAAADHLLGLAMDRLEESGGATRTLVVVTSPTGEAFGEHGTWGHGDGFHREVLHVPLVMRLPGTVPAGARYDEVVELLDVVPTALSAVGVPRPGTMQGRDLSDLFTGGTPDPARVAIAEAPAGGPRVRALLTASRLFVDDLDSGRARLYDRRKDPAERDDLLARGDPAAAALVPVLREQAREHRAGRGTGGRYVLHVDVRPTPGVATRVVASGPALVGLLRDDPPLPGGAIRVADGGGVDLLLPEGGAVHRLAFLCRDDGQPAQVHLSDDRGPLPTASVRIGAGEARPQGEPPIVVDGLGGAFGVTGEPAPLPEGVSARIWAAAPAGGTELGPGRRERTEERLRALGYLAGPPPP